jgi:hypothetical protein
VKMGNAPMCVRQRFAIATGFAVIISRLSTRSCSFG